MKTTKGMRIATVWKLCIEMWDWIVERIQAGDKRTVDDLKIAWCKKHGYDITLSCFFCDISVKRKARHLHTKLACTFIGCKYCPGKEIHKGFACQITKWHWRLCPIAFHAKLHRMYKKFLKESK